jgi:hypothetical protein
VVPQPPAPAANADDSSSRVDSLLSMVNEKLDVRITNLEKHVTLMTERLTASIDRLEQIAARSERRLQAVEAFLEKLERPSEDDAQRAEAARNELVESIYVRPNVICDLPESSASRALTRVFAAQTLHRNELQHPGRPAGAISRWHGESQTRRSPTYVTTFSCGAKCLGLKNGARLTAGWVKQKVAIEPAESRTDAVVHGITTKVRQLLERREGKCLGNAEMAQAFARFRQLRKNLKEWVIGKIKAARILSRAELNDLQLKEFVRSFRPTPAAAPHADVPDALLVIARKGADEQLGGRNAGRNGAEHESESNDEEPRANRRRRNEAADDESNERPRNRQRRDDSDAAGQPERQREEVRPAQSLAPSPDQVSLSLTPVPVPQRPSQASTQPPSQSQSSILL